MQNLNKLKIMKIFYNNKYVKIKKESIK